MLNVARLNQLADHLETTKDRFHFDYSGCIVGHTLKLFTGKPVPIYTFLDPMFAYSTVAGLLGLTRDQYYALTYEWPASMHKAPDRAWAVRTLRYLADTGRVDWGAARTYVRPTVLDSALDDVTYEATSAVVRKQLAVIAGAAATAASLLLTFWVF